MDAVLCLYSISLEGWCWEAGLVSLPLGKSLGTLFRKLCLNSGSPKELGLISALCSHWTRELSRSFLTQRFDFTHVSSASFMLSWDFFFKCRSCVVYFLFYLSYITDGTSKWLFRLIINTLTFYSNFMCFRNSVLFTSRNEPILPAFLWVIIPCQDDKVQKCWSSPTSGIVASFPEYLFSLF